jgi:glucose-6-phosphate 1-dehydrogenase
MDNRHSGALVFFGATGDLAYKRSSPPCMAGDTTSLARVDYVEEAWRIIYPVLRAGTAVYEYEPGTWGPAPEPAHDTVRAA